LVITPTAEHVRNISISFCASLPKIFGQPLTIEQAVNERVLGTNKEFDNVIMDQPIRESFVGQSIATNEEQQQQPQPEIPIIAEVPTDTKPAIATGVKAKKLMFERKVTEKNNPTTNANDLKKAKTMDKKIFQKLNSEVLKKNMKAKQKSVEVSIILN
jgi:hypothetical protein